MKKIINLIKQSLKRLFTKKPKTRKPYEIEIIMDILEKKGYQLLIEIEEDNYKIKANKKAS